MIISMLIFWQTKKNRMKTMKIMKQKIRKMIQKEGIKKKKKRKMLIIINWLKKKKTILKKVLKREK